ncbi:VPA1262 family N-terminal domain-containing protein [Sphingopyxis sp. 22461]|uniref:VPA1262 family N-terminal domain-containing protein n=1 Tax=Sphingopyxis sp. 22461 TaxID=3453923 RepID=UPI003F87A743
MTSDTGTDFTKMIAEIERLAEPDVLGRYDYFEVVEICGFPKGETPLNIFTVIVAETGNVAVPSRPVLEFVGERFNIRSLKDWSFGVIRYRVLLPQLLSALSDLSQGGSWALSGKPLRLGAVEAIPRRFAPSDSMKQLPWNGLLKNNFWGGSYLLELADCSKTMGAPLIDHPRRLQELSQKVADRIPITLASASERLGNILVQLPVTAVMAKLNQRLSEDRFALDIAWAPGIAPRPLRFSTERRFDDMVVASRSTPVTEGRSVVELPEGAGLESAQLWDDDHGVLLWYDAPAARLQQINSNMTIGAVGRRIFNDTDGTTQVVTLSHSPPPLIVGKGQRVPFDQLIEARLYRDGRERLARERRFVQYKPTGNASADHQRAIADIRFLLERYGAGGAWLWDPYLSASDVLKTLFHCPHEGAELRALSSANSVLNGTSPSISATKFVSQERSLLKANGGNCLGLRLEFRARVGASGWDFHDRFLIFPSGDTGPLAWSLGTSLNMLGKSHHILQRVDDARLVADAFEELWDRLTAKNQLVWKTP